MKPTNVTETPESRRLAENTRLQSQVKYHEDFERTKGKVTQVADDPETVRILNAHRIISNVAYHGDLERKKQMEEKRILVSPDGTAAPQDTNGGSKANSLAQQPASTAAPASGIPIDSCSCAASFLIYRINSRKAVSHASLSAGGVEAAGAASAAKNQ